jgi:hypothetical protein
VCVEQPPLTTYRDRSIGARFNVIVKNNREYHFDSEGGPQDAQEWVKEIKWAIIRFRRAPATNAALAGPVLSTTGDELTPLQEVLLPVRR